MNVSVGDLTLMLDTIQFYATEKNWHSRSTGMALQYDPEPSPIDRDKRGEVARTTLMILRETGVTAALREETGVAI
jgi:hypothetical protein